MKVLKYIAQIIASVAFTFIACWVLAWLLSRLLIWMAGLSVGWMIVLIIIFGGTLTSLIVGAGSLLAIPYFWTNKNNIVSTVLSTILIVVNYIWWIITIWKIPHGDSFVEIVTLLVFTGLLLELGYCFVAATISGYHGMEDW